MKTFDQLTATEQKLAVGICLSALLDDILTGRLRFADAENSDDLQARIDAAIKIAEQRNTPWFAREYILEDSRLYLEALAQGIAEQALYAERNERVINGVAA